MMIPKEIAEQFALTKEEICLLKAYDPENITIEDSYNDDNLGWWFYVHAADKEEYLKIRKAYIDADIAQWNNEPSAEKLTPYSNEAFIEYFTNTNLGKCIDYLARTCQTVEDFAESY